VTADDLFLFSAAITTENRNKPTAGRRRGGCHLHRAHRDDTAIAAIVSAGLGKTLTSDRTRYLITSNSPRSAPSPPGPASPRWPCTGRHRASSTAG